MDSRRIEQIRKEASEERRTLRGGDGLSAHFAGLCLELLEHIIEQSALVSRLQAQLQSASYREVLNLRTMVARLTPLEFLLAKGGDPMDQMAEKIRELSDKLNRTESIGSKLPMAPHVFAQMVNRVRDLAFDFGTSEQFRDRVADLLGKYIHVEHGSKGEPEQTEAPAVVVPEVPMGTALQRLGLRLTQILDGHEFAVLEHEFLNPAIEEMQNLSVLSGRVLGDGMRQIDARRFARMQAEEAERPYLLELERYVRTMARLQNWSKDTTDHGPLSSLDRLRANQGGAAR